VFGYPPLLFFLGEKTKGTPTLLRTKGLFSIMLKPLFPIMLIQLIINYFLAVYVQLEKYIYFLARSE